MAENGSEVARRRLPDPVPPLDRRLVPRPADYRSGYGASQ
jgi:hypothetical protein